MGKLDQLRILSDIEVNGLNGVQIVAIEDSDHVAVSIGGCHETLVRRVLDIDRAEVGERCVLL